MKAINSKEQRKKQKQALKKALNAEKSQGAALRRLKSLDKQYKFFNLTDFQRIIVNNQNEFFSAVQASYTKTQNKKLEQLQRIKDKKPLLMNKRHKVVYNGGNGEITLKTFGDKDKAEKFCKKSNLSKLKIEETETAISTSFTPSEMQSVLFRMEEAFFKQYKEAKAVTVAMVKRSLDLDVTDKDKAISTSKKGKHTPNKKAS